MLRERFLQPKQQSLRDEFKIGLGGGQLTSLSRVHPFRQDVFDSFYNNKAESAKLFLRQHIFEVSIAMKRQHETLMPAFVVGFFSSR